MRRAAGKFRWRCSLCALGFGFAETDPAAQVQFETHYVKTHMTKESK